MINNISPEILLLLTLFSLNIIPILVFLYKVIFWIKNRRKSCETFFSYCIWSDIKTNANILLFATINIITLIYLILIIII